MYFWNEIKRMQDEMDAVFSKLIDCTPVSMGRGRDLQLQGQDMGSISKDMAVPLVDFHGNNEEFFATFDLPGIPKESIVINATEDSIELKGTKETQKKEEKEGIYCCERSYSGFYRKLKLPEKIVPDKVSADLKNGVLELRMPKLDQGKKKVKQITVK